MRIGVCFLGVVNPWLLQMHNDFDTLSSTVDDLQLDAQVIDRRYREFFKVRDKCTELGSAPQHLIHFDVHATRPTFVVLEFPEQ